MFNAIRVYKCTYVNNILEWTWSLAYCCVKITPVENSSEIYGFSQCLTYKTDDSPENEGKPKQKQHWCKLTLWEDLGLKHAV